MQGGGTCGHKSNEMSEEVMDAIVDDSTCKGFGGALRKSRVECLQTGFCRQVNTGVVITAEKTYDM